MDKQKKCSLDSFVKPINWDSEQKNDKKLSRSKWRETIHCSGSEPSPPDVTRMSSSPDSTRTFRPAGSEEAITIHDLEVENGGGCKMS